MDNYILLGTIFGTPRNKKEMIEWLRRNEFDYIRLHENKGNYVIYYRRKNKELVELCRCNSLEKVKKFVEKYCTLIHKMACDTNEECFDKNFDHRLFALMGLSEQELRNMLRENEWVHENEKLDSPKTCKRKIGLVI